MYITTSGGTTLLTLGNTGSADFVGAITTPNLYLGGGSVRLSPGTNGEVGINYNTSATGSLVWYAGGTASKFNVTNAGNATFAGTISASNFSGSSSGTNTGDQTLPTLSSLGALSTSAAASTYLPLAGGTMTGILSHNNRAATNVAHWSAINNTTGAVRITLPGSHGSNWSMLVLRITAYEYNSSAHTIYYVSGHD